jgi:hypothetical protein
VVNWLSDTGLQHDVPRPLGNQTPRRTALIGRIGLAIATTLFGGALGPLRAAAMPAADPTPAAKTVARSPLVRSFRLVADAAEAMATLPMTKGAVGHAEASLREADTLLGPDLAQFPTPPAWCRARQLDGMAVVELFNQFNETADAVEQARKLDNGLVWQSDPASRRYVLQKLDRLCRAKKNLSAEQYQLYVTVARDGDTAVSLAPPWVRWSGIRYGYDIGRFHRQETYGLSAGMVVRHAEPIPLPWTRPESCGPSGHPSPL